MEKLIFRQGVMGCGKTALLLQVAYNYESKGMNVKVLKPSIDSKGDYNVVSRIGLERKVDYLIDENDDLKEYLNQISKENLKCILVDEAQFLSSEQIEQLFYFTKYFNVPVICYGLRNDFRSYLFSGSKRLFELADQVEELVTICDCGKKARFNARIVNEEYVLDGEQCLIDGVDNIRYESMCGECYLKKVLRRK